MAASQPCGGEEYGHPHLANHIRGFRSEDSEEEKAGGALGSGRLCTQQDCGQRRVKSGNWLGSIGNAREDGARRLSMAETGTETVYLLAAFVCAAVGACFDCYRRRIPNRLTVPSILLALALHGVLRGWADMVSALLSGLAAGSIFLVFYLAGGMGGGDVKLITAVATFAGSDHVVNIVIATALVGGLMALVLAAIGRRLRQTLANVGQLLAHHGTAGLQPHPALNLSNPENVRLPYGVAIGLGAGITLARVLMGH